MKIASRLACFRHLYEEVKRDCAGAKEGVRLRERFFKDEIEI